MTRIIKFKQEEYEIFVRRLETIKEVLNKIVENKLDVINEDDWLANLEWEQRRRYETYKTISESLLYKGMGIEEFKSQAMMAMGGRVKQLEIQIINILASTIDIEEKAIKISKILVEDYTDGK